MPSSRGLLAALMCISLLGPSDMAAAQQNPAPSPRSEKSKTSARPAHRPGQLQGDQRILHALNRFTFGPRSADLEAVRTLGLDRWFNLQLHPGLIDESALNTRLADYPAMQASTEDLLYRFPSNAVIRQAIDSKVSIPEQSILHAVYQDQMYRVAEKKQEKQNQQQTPDRAANSMMAAMSTSSIASSPAASLPPDFHPSDPGLIPAILALPPQHRIARITAMPPADAEAFFKSLKGPQRAALTTGMPPELKETIGALESPERHVVEALLAERLTRDTYSNAQLQEVMTDFWLNHFNVFLRKNEATPYYLVSYVRDAIRPHALGRFEDLLDASAHSPAMLLYLDNSGSIGPDSVAAERARMREANNAGNPRKNREGLNENYARELMELHTLGVNGGYKQADVIQVARILTGWTVDRPQRGGGFRFDPSRHEPGNKKVLGKTFKENGEREGLDLLHLLSTRPATARFISRKLAVRFVSDDPPQSLVDRMAASYLSSGGDISTVLKTMFHSPEFWSPGNYRAKVKTPLEYVVSAARASNADIANFQPLANALREMGMPLFGAIPPTGYKWEAADWVSTGALVNRMNFALSLASNRLSGITIAWSRLTTADVSEPDTRPVNPPQSEELRLESTLLAGGVSDATRSAVLQQFAAQNTDPQAQPQPVKVSANPRPQNRAPANAQEKQDQLLAGLLLGSPEFQRR